MICTLAASIGLPFIPGADDLRPFVAELWLIGSIVAMMITPFFAKKSNIACAIVALVGLGAALLSLLIVGGGLTPASYLRGMLVSDSVAFFWKIMLLVFTFSVVLMWFAVAAPRMHEGDGPEFFTLLLGACLGMCLMASTSNLLMLVIAVEMSSLPSYVLAGFRKTHRVGAEASLKYVLFGAVSSAVMIYGMSIFYGLFGSLDIATIGAGLAHGHFSSLLVVAFAGLIVGLGFKISAVPFHFWCPDVFEGASIDVTAFLSVASKGAALVLLTRVTMTLANAFEFSTSGAVASLAGVIGLLGVLSCTVGNTSAYFQNNIKRLLAYSSIAHAGYILCAVSLLAKSASAADSFVPAQAAVQSVLLYLAVYLFMNLGAFTVAGLVWRATGSEDLDAFKGLSRRNPVLAFCMTMFLFSLIGLPPMAGFNAKFQILGALIQNGSWWWWLVVAIGVNTVLSLYFYVRVVRKMYLESSDQPEFTSHPLGMGISVACTAMLFALFIGFGSLVRLTDNYKNLYLPGASHAQVQTSEQVAGR